MNYPKYCYYRNGSLRSQKAIRLGKLLERFSKDNEFIMGVLNGLRSDQEVQLVIDHVENNEEASYESVILLSLDISLQREQSSDRPAKK